MKKLLFLLLPLLFLTACTESMRQQEEFNRQMILERAKQRTIELETQAKIEASKTPEQRATERQLELAQKQAKSMEYLEKSKKVHDTIEAVGVGIRIFEALSY